MERAKAKFIEMQKKRGTERVMYAETKTLLAEELCKFN